MQSRYRGRRAYGGICAKAFTNRPGQLAIHSWTTSATNADNPTLCLVQLTEHSNPEGGPALMQHHKHISTVRCLPSNHTINGESNAIRVYNLGKSRPAFTPREVSGTRESQVSRPALKLLVREFDRAIEDEKRVFEAGSFHPCKPI